MKLTIVVTKGEEFYIGTIKEIPAVVSQGSTIEEAREMVLDALQLYLQDMQQERVFENTVLEEDLVIA
jgi:predicted RNase H-like HicB family nuclease